MFSRKKEKSLVTIPITTTVSVIKRDTLSLSNRLGCRPVVLLSGINIPKVNVEFALMECDLPQGTDLELTGKLKLYNGYHNHREKQLWWVIPKSVTIYV